MVISDTPVMVSVGYVPISPPSVVGPVFVTPAPARTEKDLAVPKSTAVAAAPAMPAGKMAIPAAKAETVAIHENRLVRIIRLAVGVVILSSSSILRSGGPGRRDRVCTACAEFGAKHATLGVLAHPNNSGIQRLHTLYREDVFEP